MDSRVRISQVTRKDGFFMGYIMSLEDLQLGIPELQGLAACNHAN